MIPEAYIDLVDKLYIKTMDGKANWKRTAVENRFLIDFKNFSLTIQFFYEDREPSSVKLALYDENGKIIDDFELLEIPESAAYDKLYSMYGAARRKALRIDEAINLITKELDSETIVGVDTSDDDYIPEIEEEEITM